MWCSCSSWFCFILEKKLSKIAKPEDIKFRAFLYTFYFKVPGLALLIYPNTGKMFRKTNQHSVWITEHIVLRSKKKIKESNNGK